MTLLIIIEGKSYKMTKLLLTATNNHLKFDSYPNVVNVEKKRTRTWCSNGTPKSVTKVNRNLTENFYHYMRNVDFPMRVNYCWNFSESHRSFFNQIYFNKFYCNVCGNRTSVSESGLSPVYFG